MKALSLCIGAVALTWWPSGCAAAVAAPEAGAASPAATTTNIKNVTLSEIFCDTAYGNRTPSNTPTSKVVWTWSTTSTIFGHKYIITVSPTTNQTIKTVRKTQTSTFTAQNTITNTITTTTTSTVTTLTTLPDSLKVVAPATTTITRTIPTSKGFTPIQSQSKQSSWGVSQDREATGTPASAKSTHAAQPRAVSIKARYEGASGTVVQNVTCCTQYFVWDTVASPDATTTITSHTGRVKTITTVIMSTTTVTKKLGPTTTTLTATSTGLTTTTSTVSAAAASSTSSSSSSSPAAASTTSSSSSAAASTTSTTTSTPGAAASSSAASSSSPSDSAAATPVRHAAHAAGASPVPTATVYAFAQCQPNNMLSTLGAPGTAFIASASAGPKASALLITGIHTAHACCVACAKQHDCAGYAFERDLSRCALYLSPNDCEDPARPAWQFHSAAEPPPPATGVNGAKRLTVGNGQCGVAKNLGEK